VTSSLGVGKVRERKLREGEQNREKKLTGVGKISRRF